MSELESLQALDEEVTLAPWEIDNIVRQALQDASEELDGDEMEVIYDVVYNAVALTESHLRRNSTY